MVQRSWFYRNGLFYTILALVLLIHLVLMAVRMFKDIDLVDQRTPESRTGPPLKVKIVREPEVSTKKQIVQSDDVESKEKPKDKSFLSDKDRKVDRETIAKKVAPFKSPGKGTATKDSLSLSDLGAFDKSHDPLKAASKTMNNGQAKSNPSKAGVVTGDMQKRGVSSTNDFVEEVPLGDLTYLNTVEYKYYGFYHRIRQKLEQFWGRSIQEKAEAFMKEGRRVASEENLVTSLVVTLNTEGEIVDITIKGASGVKELDEAAVESFNEAGPFPNPPKGLVENGQVKIEWGFVVQT